MTNVNQIKKIHANLITSGLSGNRVIIAEVIQSLSKFKDQENYASQVLQHVNCHLRSPFLLNLVLSGKSIARDPKLALSLFKCAIGCGFSPDRYTFPVILKYCGKDFAIDAVSQIQGIALKLGFFGDIFVQNALVHAYGICKCLCDARKMFEEMPVRDIVSWTGLISAYVKGGFFHEAVSFFDALEEEPNEATLVSMLVAFGRLGQVNKGRRIHGYVLKLRLERGLVMGNALIDMYVKSGSLADAKAMFDELPLRDVISWTSIITGLVQWKHPKEALELFGEMQASGIEPDKVTLSSLLSACASLGALDIGKWIHKFIDQKGISWDIHISTSMIDMYAKCGCIEIALHLFEKMVHKNIFTWNAILSGLAMNGFGGRVIECYDGMIRSGIVPNEVTFIALLGACSHCGLVREGQTFFNAMSKVYGLSPKIEHYGCMVDLLCRAELLQEALRLVQSMPMEADPLIWSSLLAACRSVEGNKISQKIINCVMESKPRDSGIYVLLSNIHASAGRWGDSRKLRTIMQESGIKKEIGSSLLIVGNTIEEFVAGGEDWHLERKEMQRVLTMLHCMGLPNNSFNIHL